MIGLRMGIYSGKGAAFTGILDTLVNQPIVAFSYKRLTNVSWATGDPIARFERSSDLEQADFSYNSITNELDANSISFNSSSGTTNGQTFTSWSGIDTISTVTIYNQVNYSNSITRTNSTSGAAFTLLNKWNVGTTASHSFASSINITGSYMSFAKINQYLLSANQFYGFRNLAENSYLCWIYRENAIKTYIVDRYAGTTSLFIFGGITTGNTFLSTYRNTPATSSYANYANTDFGAKTYNSKSFTLLEAMSAGLSYCSDLFLFDTYNESDYSTMNSYIAL